MRSFRRSLTLSPQPVPNIAELYRAGPRRITLSAAAVGRGGSRGDRVQAALHHRGRCHPPASAQRLVVSFLTETVVSACGTEDYSAQFQSNDREPRREKWCRADLEAG